MASFQMCIRDSSSVALMRSMDDYILIKQQIFLTVLFRKDSKYSIHGSTDNKILFLRPFISYMMKINYFIRCFEVPRYHRYLSCIFV